jgi:type I restriction enzyme S subunit
VLEFKTLKEVGNLTVGFVGNMSKQYESRGIPFLRSLNIKPYKIVANDMKYISSDFSQSIKKSELHEGDVVIVRTGIPGTCCVVPKEYDGCNCSDVVIVHPDRKKVNPHYLAAYINIWGQKQIRDNKVGAIQQHFNVRTAEEMKIALPSIEEQDRIGRIITNLNDKIICNERINDNLPYQSTIAA